MQIMRVIKQIDKAPPELPNSWDNPLSHGITKNIIVSLYLPLNLNIFLLGCVVPKFFGCIINSMIMVYVLNLSKYSMTTLVLSAYLRILCIILDQNILMLTIISLEITFQKEIQNYLLRELIFNQMAFLLNLSLKKDFSLLKNLLA